MKLGNFVLRCAFLQIFIVFALYSYAQSTNEDVHKYKMIEAINSGNFEEAAKEIVNVKDWTFIQSDERSFLDVDSFMIFMTYVESSTIEGCFADSLCLYVVDELYAYNSMFLDNRNFQASIAILEAILSIQQQILGTEHLEYAISLHNLAFVYSRIGNYVQAEILYKEALGIYKNVFGEEHSDYATGLNNLALVYYNMGNYIEAEKLNKEALGIRRKVLGEEHLDYALSLNNLAVLYSDMGKYDDAEKMHKEALEIRRKVLGVEHPDYATSLDNLASVYFDNGNYKEAIKLYKESLAVRKKVLGIMHPDYVVSINNLAVAYFREGNYEEALILYKESLEISKILYGEEHSDYALILNNLAEVYCKIGNYAESKSLHVKALEIRKKVLGIKHPDYALSLSNLASIYDKMGNYLEAERMNKEALDIYKNIFGSENQHYIGVLNNLALVYDNMGNYDEAENLHKEILGIYQNVLGVENLSYAMSLNNLASVYSNRGDYEEAVNVYKESLRIYKNVLGEEHPEYATILNNLATIYSDMGNYIEAEKLYKKSLQIRKLVFGVEHVDYASSLHNLATVYSKMGNCIKAENLYKKALEIRKNVLGVDHLDYASSLNNLAVIYSKMGNYIKAENLYKEVLEICKNILGVEHPYYALGLNSLGSLYSDMGNYVEAEKLHKEALLIIEKKFGRDHYDYALSLNNLACIYGNMRNYIQAEFLYKEALKICRKVFGEGHPNYANILNNLACLYLKMKNYVEAEKMHKEALRIWKNIWGINHLDYAVSLNNLSFVFLDIEQYDKVEPLFIEHSNIIKKQFKTNFEFLSEKERQLYWDTESYNFNIYYPSFCYSYYPQKKSISEFAYNNAILTKGLLLNASTQVQNAILNSGNQTLIDQWNELCGLRQQIVFLQNKTLEEQENAGITALEERANELDKQLTASSSEFKQGKEIWDIEWDDVKKKLKPNEVAIEFISFDYYHKGEFTDSTLYCALLLRNNSQYPEMITLFEEKELSVFANKTIDGKVASNLIYSFFVNEEDGDTTGYGMKLSQLVWSKILPKIKEGETVYFSPSGLFHQLAIESLPYDENRRMSDVYNLVRLSSTREIVLNKNNTNQYSTATLYGGIHYDTSTKDLLAESSNYSQETLLASRGVENDTLDRGSVNYLPGTKQEAEKINKMLVDNNITAQLYTMSQANEESFKNLSNKHQNIIHIGTHGFAWTDSVAKKKDYFAERMQMIGEDQQYRGPIIDPLNRCGLLFAGANIALQGKSRELPEGVQDGILTAKEISLLDLRDCDLVVLSACETAKGDVTSEGVFGLQRAFKMAGVQTIIMSLWKVNDEATQMLMTKFYNNWIVKKQEKREAFNNAQNAVRMKYAEPVYWAGFVMLD